VAAGRAVLRTSHPVPGVQAACSGRSRALLTTSLVIQSGARVLPYSRCDIFGVGLKRRMSAPPPGESKAKPRGPCIGMAQIAPVGLSEMASHPSLLSACCSRRVAEVRSLFLLVF
jgi:hypothetical protein